MNQTHAQAVGHYADYGPVRSAAAPDRSYQGVFGVAGYTVNDANSVEAGIGFGLAKQSGAMLVKPIIDHHL